MNSSDIRAGGPPPAPRLLRATALAVFALALLHLAGLVCDYSRCFQDAEVYGHWAGRILMYGKNFSCSDFAAALDAFALDGDSRPRFLSYLCVVWTVKARLALWNFLPPHPSFSPVWIFSLLLAPWGLYRFLKGELGCPWRALLGTGLYLATAGYLSSASMLFHSGKGLANVAVIGTLLAALRANRSLPADPAAPPRFPAAMIVFLVGVLPVLLFADETALFALVVLPIWNSRFFFPRRWTGPHVRACLGNLAWAAVPPAVFLLFVFFAAPRLAHSFYGVPFDFGSYLARNGEVGKFDLPHLVQNATTLLAAAMAPWSALRTAIPVAEAPIHGGWILAGCLAAWAGLGGATFIRRRHAATFARAGLLAILFVVFQTLVDAHHPSELVASGFYYGGIFSVWIAILLACALGSFWDGPRLRWLAVGAAGYFLAIQLANFAQLNRSWIAHNHFKTANWIQETAPYNPWLAYCDMSEIRVRISQLSGESMYQDDVPSLRPDRRRATVELWQRRAGGYRSYLGQHPLALEDLSLLMELYYGRTPGRISAGAAAAGPEDRRISMYRAVLARAHLGQPDEELPPVLAYFKIQDGGLTTRFIYPWFTSDIHDGVDRFRSINYANWLVPLDGPAQGTGPYWGFHNEIMKALAEHRLFQYGLVETGRIQVDGRKLLVLAH